MRNGNELRAKIAGMEALLPLLKPSDRELALAAVDACKALLLAGDNLVQAKELIRDLRQDILLHSAEYHWKTPPELLERCEEYL